MDKHQHHWLWPTESGELLDTLYMVGQVQKEPRNRIGSFWVLPNSRSSWDCLDFHFLLFRPHICLLPGFICCLVCANFIFIKSNAMQFVYLFSKDSFNFFGWEWDPIQYDSPLWSMSLFQTSHWINIPHPDLISSLPPDHDHWIPNLIPSQTDGWRENWTRGFAGTMVSCRSHQHQSIDSPKKW